MAPTLIFETTAEYRPGFPPLLWEAARDVLGCVTRPVYFVYRTNLSAFACEYHADVYVTTSALGSLKPYVSQSHFVDSPEMAIQAAAWNCLARLRYFEPAMEPQVPRFFPHRTHASSDNPLPSTEVVPDPALTHLVAYTTALESVLIYHMEESHEHRQALARVPQPAGANPAPQDRVIVQLQQSPPAMEALKFGLDTFCPGPAAASDLQHLRSFGIVPEGIPETLAIAARGPVDTKLHLGPAPQAPKGGNADETKTKPQESVEP